MAYVNILSFFFLMLVSCSLKRSDIVGMYSAVSYLNTYDTILIKKGGDYERKVYDKSKNLALKMNGKWEYENGALVMHSFFLNLDRDIVAFPELLADTSMSMEVQIERNGGQFKFCTGYLNNQNCYQKVK